MPPTLLKIPGVMWDMLPIFSFVVQVRKAMQRKKEIWSSRRTTFFSPSSTNPSSKAVALTSQGAALSVIVFDICQVLFT